MTPSITNTLKKQITTKSDITAVIMKVDNRESKKKVEISKRSRV